MKKIIFLFIILFILPLESYAFRGEPAAEPEAFTYGALRLSPGWHYTSLLNQDGGRAVFGGPAGNGEFDLIFTFQELDLGIGPFIHYSYSNQDNLSNRVAYSQEIERNETLYGIKAYMFPFYVGFGYGASSTRMGLYDNGSITKKNLETNILGFTGAVRLFSLGGDWSLGFTGWYKTGFFSKAKNPNLENNTNMETIELMLTISISPLFQLL